MDAICKKADVGVSNYSGDHMLQTCNIFYKIIVPDFVEIKVCPDVDDEGDEEQVTSVIEDERRIGKALGCDQ